MKRAMFYKHLAEGKVRCDLCAHHCVISQGSRGVCGVRENQHGTLYTLVFGMSIAHHIDPIEKKPLFHFLPGSSTYSIGTVGCNFRCLYCWNYKISQYPSENGGNIIGEKLSPEVVAQQAYENGCRSVSFTYTEPTIFFEYAYEIAVIAKQKGIRSVLKTNGYLTKEALQAFAPLLDAANIDLKGFNDIIHRKVVGAKLGPVLDCIKLMKELGIWIEISTPIIPRINDSDKELREIASFIKSVDPEIPWHVSRFYPNYKMSMTQPTPIKKLYHAKEIGLEEGLHYVYIGHVPGEGEDTYCHNCGRLVIQRSGYMVIKSKIAMEANIARCPNCKVKIPGVWA